MQKKIWWTLQLFADGAGDGAGTSGAAGSPAGETAADAGQNDESYESRLAALGVPKEKIRSRAKQSGIGGTAQEPKQPAAAQDAAVQEEANAERQANERQAAAAEETQGAMQDAGKRMSWDEIMADPEYNQQMQKTIQKSLRGRKAAQQTLEALGPALELLGSKYGIDASDVTKLDADALREAVLGDTAYYQDKADEMGTSVETAMRMDRLERDAERRRQQDRQNAENARIRNHFMELQQQGERLKETFPTFDLGKELQSPVFARMTSPNGGVSVEDAYYAVHRKELQEASMQVAAQKTAEKIAASIAANQARPVENGAGQAASIAVLDYRNMSKQQRQALR